MKKQLSSVEQSLSKLFKDLPRLPKGFTDWLADNIWWIVIISVVFGVFAVFASLTATLTVGPMVAALVGVPVGGSVLLAGLANVAVLAAVVVVEAMAIQPLKLKQKSGWDLLLVSSLVGVAGSVLVAFLRVSVGSALWAVLGAAIGLYVLFEIRGYFVVAKNGHKKS